MNFTKCPNCGASLKGFLHEELIEQFKTDFINKYLNKTNEAYCSACANPLFKQISDAYKKQKDELEARLKKNIHNIPILTSPAPIKWEYEVIGILTAQTTSGTGFATELSRSFNDFFGSTSNSTNQKVANATELCKSDLRIQCVKAGGNAIISTSIDFNEIGAGSTNMLMVCISGTAIRVTDMANFSDTTRDSIIETIELTQKLDVISEMNK